jgi:hypothetical protein
LLAAAVRTREQGVLSIERDRANASLDDIGIDLDAAVVNEAGQAFSTRERIADRLGALGLLADQGKLRARPWLDIVDDRTTFFLAEDAPLFDAATVSFWTA